MESINSKPSTSEVNANENLGIKTEECIEPEETIKTNPKLFLKIIGTQTIKVEVNEYFKPRDLAVLACLCK